MQMYTGLAAFQHPAHSEKVLELVSPSRLPEPESHLSELTHSLHSCFSSSLGTLRLPSNSPSASCDPHCINLKVFGGVRNLSPEIACCLPFKESWQSVPTLPGTSLPIQRVQKEKITGASLLSRLYCLQGHTSFNPFNRSLSLMPSRNNHESGPPLPKMCHSARCTDKTYFHHNTIFSDSINP